MGIISYIHYLFTMRKNTPEPRKKAKLFLKIANNDFKKAHDMADKRMAKSVPLTIGYFYWKDVKIELDRLKPKKT